MSIEERDVRMIVVAFEDAVTWCESLLALGDRLVASLRSGQTLEPRELDAAAAQLADTRRYLESNEGSIQRIRSRAGLA